MSTAVRLGWGIHRLLKLLLICMLMLLLPVLTVVSQEDVSAPLRFFIFRTVDSLTIYVPAQGAISAEHLGSVSIEVQIEGERRAFTLASYDAFGIIFAQQTLNTPLCLRLIRTDSTPTLELDCPVTSDSLFVQFLSPADVFWVDSVTNLNPTLLVTRAGQVIGGCSSINPRCEIGEQIQPPTPNAPRSAQDYMIAWYGNQTGSHEIYTLLLDNPSPFPLTSDGGDNRFPAWSPDGNQLIFQSKRDGDDDIYRINVDGSDLQNITQNGTEDRQATWSPRGDAIAYISAVGPSNWDILILNLNTGERRNLTQSDGVEEGGPAWSPDGNSIAYHSNLNGNFDIFIEDVNGNATRQMTFSEGDELMPDWSPDGRYLAFSSGGQDQSDIYVLNVIQGLLYRLTASPVFNLSADWLPDGRIAFSSNRDGDFEIYVMNPDGSGLQVLTNNSAVDGSPTARPQSGLVTALGPDAFPVPVERPAQADTVSVSTVAIGQPLGSSFTTWAAYQPYEQGFMVWRQDSDDVYVFMGSERGSVTIVPITVYNSFPGASGSPPESRVLPINAFGRVWANFGQVRTQLGWAMVEEQGYNTCITNYQRHIALSLPPGSVVMVEHGTNTWRYANGNEAILTC